MVKNCFFVKIRLNRRMQSKQVRRQQLVDAHTFSGRQVIKHFDCSSSPSENGDFTFLQSPEAQRLVRGGDELYPRECRAEPLDNFHFPARMQVVVDFIQEPLEGYSDAEIGAAARDVHRQCGAVLKRLFDLQPVVGDEEGAAIEVPPGFETGMYHLVGNVTGNPPYRGKLVDPGGPAARVRRAEGTGSPAAARIVAPVEVEVT